MHRIFLIARRDYLERIKSKAYLFGLIIFPLLFGGSFLAIALANRANTREQRVALIDHTGVAAAAVMARATIRRCVIAWLLSVGSDQSWW